MENQLQAYGQRINRPTSWADDQLRKVWTFVTDNLTEPNFQIKAIQKCVDVLTDPLGAGKRMMYPHQVGAHWAVRISHWRICYDVVPMGSYRRVVWRKIDRRDKVYGNKGHGK